MMGWKEGQGVGARIDAKAIAHMSAKQRSRAYRRNFEEGDSEVCVVNK